MTIPTIVIPENIKNKIQFIVNECSLEVSGLGTVIYDKVNNGYKITDMCLLKQEVGAVHTDLDDDAVAQALWETREAEGELCFWWHSHVNMDTFWSRTDHDTMDDIGKNGLCVAIVFNKKEEMRGAIVMSPKDMPQVKFDNVDILVEHSYDFDTEKLQQEIKEKVQPKKYAAVTHTAAGVLSSKGFNYLEGFKTNPKFIELRKACGKKWAIMSKLARNDYVNFDDFFEQECWNAVEDEQMGYIPGRNNDDYFGRELV